MSGISLYSQLDTPSVDAGAWTVPNGITLAGVALTAWWLQGGPAWAAVVGLLADEVDGRLARATKQTSQFGAMLDWTSDIALTAVVLDRLGAPMAIPVVVPIQVGLRESGYRPTYGSFRALATIALLYKQWKQQGQ